MRGIYVRAREFARREGFRPIILFSLMLIVPSSVFAAPQVVQEREQHAGIPTSLSVLIEEDTKNDPAVHAAECAARAATFASSQASALPDPQFTLQQFSVGSPRP